MKDALLSIPPEFNALRPVKERRRKYFQPAMRKA